MASSYTTNSGIEKIATGEQSGTWGDTTNTNFDLIDAALEGQVTLTLPATGSTGTPNDVAITDGAASDGRNKVWLIVDGGDLGGTAYVRLTPNDAEKTIFIRNSLTASRDVIVFQGTYNAANDVVVPNGKDMVLTFDGGGAGAKVISLLENIQASTIATSGTATFNALDGPIGGTTPAAGDFTTVSASGIADFADGAEATPSIANTGDLNTGMWFPAADEIAWSLSAAEKMRLDGIGLGIGTDSPEKMIHSYHATENLLGYFESGDVIAGIALADTVGSAQISTTSGAVRFFTGGDASTPGDNSSEAMRIDSAGDVGIGTTDPLANLHIADGVPTIRLEDEGDSTYSTISHADGYMELNADVTDGISNTRIAFKIDNGEKMRLTSNGAVLIGTTTVGSSGEGDLVVNGGIFLGGSAAVNELGDYEEGTWTPTVTDSASGGVTLDGNEYGVYTKIGNMVHCQVVAVSTGDLSDNVYYNMAGLPFARAAQATTYSCVGTAFAAQTTSNRGSAHRIDITATTTARFYSAVGDDGATMNFSYGDTLEGSFSYRTDV